MKQNFLNAHHEPILRELPSASNFENTHHTVKIPELSNRIPQYNGVPKLLEMTDIEPVKLPARSPDLNCYAERFVKSIKSECLDHLILSFVKHLEYVLGQYCAYYHHERIHQGVGRIIEPKHPIDDTADIVCVKRLDGLLKSYHRLAA